MTCNQCLKELNFDPRRHAQNRGTYYPPLCKYCPSSVGGRADLPIKAQTEGWNQNQWASVQSLAGQVVYLQGQVKELQNPKRKDRI
jgi:hypothetical protein